MKPSSMHLLILTAALSAAFTPAAMARKGGSTITFGRSDEVVAKPGKKRNFRQDLQAVDKAHDGWKKAHLNTALYACQHNSERVALLARKVSDKMELSKKDALTAARAVEKTVDGALGADAVEVPESIPSGKAGALKAKGKALEMARKKMEMLDRLAGQIQAFYENDVPKVSASGGDCLAAFPAARLKGVNASRLYHTETSELRRKLERLEKLVELAWKRSVTKEMYAGR